MKKIIKKIVKKIIEFLGFFVAGVLATLLIFSKTKKDNKNEKISNIDDNINDYNDIER